MFVSGKLILSHKIIGDILKSLLGMLCHLILEIKQPTLVC